MCEYLQTKFQVSRIILTSFRQGAILPPNPKGTPKKPTQILGCTHWVISRGFQSVSWSVGLLFLEVFGILEGNFSYFIEFIYRSYL